MEYINAAAVGIVIYLICCIMLAFIQRNDKIHETTLSNTLTDTVGMFNFAVVAMATYHVWCLL